MGKKEKKKKNTAHNAQDNAECPPP